MIRYLVGDATAPRGDNPIIIAHVCNDSGRWGKGFVVALSRRWKEPEKAFRAATELGLGDLQLVPVSAGLWVANMVGQHGVARKGGTKTPPIRYDALERCLEKLATEATALAAEVHMPRIGAGLAGGDGSIIEGLILKTLDARSIPVMVYDLS